ncbi:hypothetical protein RhiirA5_445637 [Rhizophagus irregularis]|uniref:Uncharacterized protein n=1 Tax=Rhizophagus irregularis TaxID=588596 RepID=A0A2N0NC91_9GLOM|nr:hypothetical protein RhiirA5_445637 [Rhizophagus irregularis]GET61805.1 hypothetical protein RIR_jg33497.t1 [Rhizophagus irregularis DAOM 181602=DAOM 197198]
MRAGKSPLSLALRKQFDIPLILEVQRVVEWILCKSGSRALVRLPYLQDGEFEPDDLYSGTLTKAPLLKI